jgi:AraC-like DNA-binding protein
MRQPPPAPASPPRGILHAVNAPIDVEHERLLPPPDLAPWVAHFWSVRWKLQQPLEVKTLPHPVVHLTVERDADSERVVVGGPHHRPFMRTLVDEGRVVGIKFRPAMFHALCADVSRLANHSEQLDDDNAFDLSAQALAAATIGTLAASIEPLSRLLRAHLHVPAADDVIVRDLVEAAEHDRTLCRVDDLVGRSGLPLRTLQRRFVRAVGVTPKWVLLRYRLHEAAERLKAAPSTSLAALAAELGYADQAHFARDFRGTIGVPPQVFASCHAL